MITVNLKSFVIRTKAAETLYCLAGLQILLSPLFTLVVVVVSGNVLYKRSQHITNEL